MRCSTDESVLGSGAEQLGTKSSTGRVLSFGVVWGRNITSASRVPERSKGIPSTNTQKGESKEKKNTTSKEG